MEDALARLRVYNHNSTDCLNPCCNGRCTRTVQKRVSLKSWLVLILVVMEDALALGNVVRPIVARDKVLILVVMEDALAL